MVPPLHAALDLGGNQQSDGNGEQVKEELFGPVERRMRGMNIQHDFR
jgi:hypothetical protein